MKKKCHKVLEVVTEFDLFAPNVTLRYENETDYKTLTGAILSIAIIIFFTYVFVNSFITMVDRTQISSSMLALEDLDPTFYNTTTPNFLFAIGVKLLRLFSLQV